MDNKPILAIYFDRNAAQLQAVAGYFNAHLDERDCFSTIFIISTEHSKGLLDDFFENQRNRDFQHKEMTDMDARLGQPAEINHAFNLAREQHKDLVVLNAAVTPIYPCFKPLMDCFAQDLKLGICCPRTNAAGLSSFLTQTEGQPDFINEYDHIHRNLPIMSYVPVIDGLCFAIRLELIQNFGLMSALDPQEAEKEYCLRVSEYGYRIGVANHALVIGAEKTASDLTREDKALTDIYPYYPRLMSEFKQSIDFLAYTAFVSSTRSSAKRKLLLMANITDLKNGTSRQTASLACYLAQFFQIDFLCSKRVFQYHHLDTIKGVTQIDKVIEYYGIGIHVGQPFTFFAATEIPRSCSKAVCLFFDTISLDCSYLKSPKTERLWQYVTKLYNIIITPSQYSEQLLRNRYEAMADKISTVLLSSAPQDYQLPEREVRDEKYRGAVFVTGNSYKHKDVKTALYALVSCSSKKIVTLFPSIPALGERVIFFEGGYVSDEEIDDCYRQCEYVVYPSYYEGFGFPILHALAYGKTIFARKLGCYLEIQKNLAPALQDKIVYFESYEDLKQKIVDFEKFNKTSSQMFTIDTVRGEYDENASNAAILKRVNDCDGATYAEFKERYVYLNMLDYVNPNYSLRAKLEALAVKILPSRWQAKIKKLLWY